MLISLALCGLIRPAQTASAQAPVASGTVITIAGNGVGGFSGDGGPALDASNSGAFGMAIGPDGTLYFADNANFRIRAIDPATGVITTVAGDGNLGDIFTDNGDGGPATSAPIGSVLAIAVDRQRNTLYLPSLDLNRVRQVNLATGIIQNFAGIGVFDNEPGHQDGDGGPATSAYFDFPLGVAVGPGNDVLITDSYRLRSVDGTTGIISRVAGIENAQGDPVNMFGGDGGPASAASFVFPYTLTVDSAGDVYVIDLGTTLGSGIEPTRVRRIDAATGIIDTIAGGGANDPNSGSGPATSMNLEGATELAVDDAAGLLYIAFVNQVFQMDLATGQLSVFAGQGTADFSGDGGPALAAEFYNINGLEVVPGGGLLVSDTFNARIRYIAPDSINLSGDSGQTDFYLPWVSELSGDLTITNNPNLSVINVSSLVTCSGDLTITGNTSAEAIDVSSLVSVSGDLDMSGNTSAGTINVSSLVTAGGDLTITGNTSAEAINVSSLVTASGDLTITDNTAATVVNVGGLETVSGILELSGNTSAEAINVSSLVSVSGDLDMSGNTSAEAINVSSLVTASGDLAIADNTAATVVNVGGLETVSGILELSGNTSAEAINVSSLVSAGGDLTITDNGPAVVNIAENVTVGGDLTIETTGSGTFDVGGADVEGNTSLTTDGYTEVDAATAGGETAVTMTSSEATMEVTLPDGTFTSETPVAFSITNEPASVETIDGNTVTHLGTYRFEFAMPTLASDAELNFEIELAAMDEPDRLSLLDLLDDGALLTLGVRGDEPGSELQLFDVCAAGGPVADSCVVAQWLDESRTLLDPLGGIDPAFLRLEGLVGHFSTYSFVAVTLPGDFNLDGIVDAADYIVWRKTGGTQEAYDTWRANFGAVSLTIGTGNGSSFTTAVPEPAAAGLALVGFVGLLCRRNRSVVITLRVMNSLTQSVRPTHNRRNPC